MNRYSFKIDSNPLEMTRFFESQMDHLLKSFFTFDGFGQNFGESTNMFTPFGGKNFKLNLINSIKKVYETI
jgi:hypothetical protein